MIRTAPHVLSPAALLEKAKTLPMSPGVYLFFNSRGEVIYVGKSKALHNRVLSYFQNRGKHPPKTEKLVQNVADFQTIVTATEAEALILENEKIKLHKPKYNIRLKDDKDYPYIRLTLEEEYPRLLFARRKESAHDRSRYFGPYSSSGAVRSVIDTANRLFSLPTCKRRFPQEIGKGRPCLYHHLGRCIGVCTGKISPAEYRRRIEDVILFLKYDHKKIAAKLQEEMQKASEEMAFERAAALRDQIRALETLAGKRQVVRDLHFQADVFGVFQDELGGCINLTSIREGSVVDSTNFHFGAEEILSAESFSSMLVDLYRARDLRPREILLPAELFCEETQLLSEVLARAGEAPLRFRVPERGEGKRLMELASENARAAALHRRALFEKDEEVLVKLAEALSLEVLPERIESIDISNSASAITVAGIITVENARFLKRAYKSFTVDRQSPDDPESMYEAVKRRMKRYLDGDESFAPLPDLILADGAAGQVSAVKRALSELGLAIPVFGMVKDSFHKTRCLTDGEHDISIAHDPALFQFIYRIQEEVHRYGFSRMDSRRRKTVKTSSLTRIEGIGEKKAALLLREMKTVQAIRAASVETLAAVRGISRANAQAIYDHYHQKRTEKE